MGDHFFVIVAATRVSVFSLLVLLVLYQMRCFTGEGSSARYMPCATSPLDRNPRFGIADAAFVVDHMCVARATSTLLLYLLSFPFSVPYRRSCLHYVPSTPRHRLENCISCKNISAAMGGKLTVSAWLLVANITECFFAVPSGT